MTPKYNSALAVMEVSALQLAVVSRKADVVRELLVAAASAVARSKSRDQLYKIGLPGKLFPGHYFQENRTSQRPFLLPRISFPGTPIFIQLPPDPQTKKENGLSRG